MKYKIEEDREIDKSKKLIKVKWKDMKTCRVDICLYKNIWLCMEYMEIQKGRTKMYE